MIIASDDVRSRGLAEMIVAPARITMVMSVPMTSAAVESPARKMREMFSDVERDRGDAQPRQEEREQQAVLDRALGRDPARELERLVGTGAAVILGDVVAVDERSRRPVLCRRPPWWYRSSPQSHFRELTVELRETVSWRVRPILFGCPAEEHDGDDHPQQESGADLHDQARDLLVLERREPPTAAAASRRTCTAGGTEREERRGHRRHDRLQEQEEHPHDAAAAAGPRAAG